MEDWTEPPYRMTSGQATAASHVYEKIEGTRGIWLVAADAEERGAYIYYHDPKDAKSAGFGGATLSFPLIDGSVYVAKAPWHSNADSCFGDTGRDFRALHRTFVVLSKGRTSTGAPQYRTVLTEVLYKDPDGGCIGPFDRYKALAKEYPQARFYYSASQGGSSCGPLKEG